MVLGALILAKLMAPTSPWAGECVFTPHSGIVLQYSPRTDYSESDVQRKR